MSFLLLLAVGTSQSFAADLEFYLSFIYYSPLVFYYFLFLFYKYVKTGLNNPQTIHLRYFDNKWYVLVFGRLLIFCSHAAIKSIPLLGQGALIKIIIMNTFISTALTLHYNVLVRHKHLRAPIEFDNCDMQNVQVIFFISF